MKYLPAAAFGCLMLAAAPAWAAPGYTLAGVNLRAGPGTAYPVVAQMPPGIPLEVQGCLAGNAWCDVVSGPMRGWISGRYLGSAVGGPPMVSLQIGLPTVIFDLTSYWDHHYSDRRFYRDRDRYRHAPQPSHARAYKQPQPHYQQQPYRPQPHQQQPHQQQRPQQPQHHQQQQQPRGNCGAPGAPPCR